ncbi:MAG: chromatin modification- protein VID21 [Bogoriella megaspora]|nr:MAG: chromatin modification- protein VID21 [Bogoriella megaspora]
MSFDANLAGLLQTKKNELTAYENSRKRKLRELYAVTTADLGPDRCSFPPLDAPITAAELRFLNDNDITKGHFFQESTLAIPPRYLQPSHRKSPARAFRVSKSPTARSLRSRSPSNKADRSASAKAPEDVATLQDATQQSKLSTAAISEQATQVPTQNPLEQSLHPSKLSGAPATPQPPESPGIPPQAAVPPSAEDIAALPDSIDVQASSDSTSKRPKTIHLPSKEAQERHLKEIEKAQENARAREKKEDSKLLSATNAAPLDDVVSSPSSTAGPFSVATPAPNQQSPDTSPDEDNRAEAAALRTPISLGPSKQEQSEREEHDRIIKAQAEIARQEARGEDPASADAQLRLEEEQAVRQNRDQARLEASGASSAQANASLTQEASEVMKDVAMSDRDVIDDSAIVGRSTLTSPDITAIVDKTSSRQPDSSDILMQDDLSSTKILQPDSITQVASNQIPTTAMSRPSGNNIDPTDSHMSDAPLTSPAFGDEDATPQKRPPPTPVPGTAARSTTRLSSGAIRHKSVSEILGETPKLLSPSIEKTQHAATSDGQAHTVSPTTATPLTPGILATLSNNQTRPSERRDKDRSKPSAVIFAKPQSAGAVVDCGEYSQLAGLSKDSRKDYYQSMFVSQAHPPRTRTISELLASASKTLTTSNRFAEVREHGDNRVLKRLYQLQNANKWPMRQFEKAAEPPRPTSHLDHLLQEMKWMRTDFREEWKWKLATARILAQCCAEWVAADKDRRLGLQVEARIPPKDKQLLPDNTTGDVEPHVVPKQPVIANDRSAQEEADEEIRNESPTPHLVAPGTVFSLGLDDAVFRLSETPAGDKLISELPKFAEPFDASLLENQKSPSILPVSKYAKGRVLAMPTSPPRKRSRYDYESDDESFEPDQKRQKPDDDTVTATNPKKKPLSPEQDNVALFYPENRNLRDRLHMGHSFRPPSEFPMPSISFFETRQSSQWLWDEDQKLRALVKEYSYNWSLISESMSTSTIYTASPERRTPWECFERWVQLEGLPTEMQKMAYFRTYQARLEAAQRTVLAQQQAQQALLGQQGNAAGITTPIRRRTTQPVRVERRRGTKYLTILEGMRKLARKREAWANKQAEAAKAAALRKHNEAQPVKAGVHTPQEFSNLKHEQELKMQKRQELYRQQMLTQQRVRQQSSIALKAALTQSQQAAIQNQPQSQNRPAQQGNAQQGMSNGTNPQMRGGANVAGGGSNLAPPPNPHAQQAMNMQRQMLQQGLQNNMPNSNLGVPNMGMQGMPQAPMQMQMQGHQRTPSQQSPEQMRAMLARSAQQQPNGYQAPNPSQFQMQSNPTQLAAAHMLPANSGIQNQQMLAAMQGNVNMNSANANEMMNQGDNSSSPPRPRSMNQSTQPNTLSSGHVPAINQITQQIHNKNPSLSIEECQRLAIEQLKDRQKIYQQNRQNAINAAVGASHAYNHQTSQQSQQQQQGGGGGHGTPQMTNTHAHTQNQTNGLTWSNSPSQVPAQLHGASQHSHSNSQGGGGGGTAQSPQMTSSQPQPQQLQPQSHLATYTAQITQQQRSMLAQQQQQQRGMNSTSPVAANMGLAGAANMTAAGAGGMPNMGGLGGMGSPASMHAGMASPMTTGGILRPPSAGTAGGMMEGMGGMTGMVAVGMGGERRSGTPMQRPGTAGAE